jgi:hypothetical protein
MGSSKSSEMVQCIMQSHSSVRSYVVTLFEVDVPSSIDFFSSHDVQHEFARVQTGTCSSNVC